MSLRFPFILVLDCLILCGCTGLPELYETGSALGRSSEKNVELIERPNDGLAKLSKGQYEVFGKIYETLDSSLGYLEIGVASWYGRKFHGRLTAMGDVYDMYGMTAAHKALPLPTMVRVTNLDNGKSIILRVNDRGPFHDDRLIDLSYGGARALGFEKEGTVPVVVEAIDEINYPEIAKRVNQENYYLQAGAFVGRAGAEIQMAKVRDALPPDVQVRILVSENIEGMLHKIWVGPVTSIREEKLISERIQDRNLGKPMKVIVGGE